MKSLVYGVLAFAFTSVASSAAASTTLCRMMPGGGSKDIGPTGNPTIPWNASTNPLNAPAQAALSHNVGYARGSLGYLTTWGTNPSLAQESPTQLTQFGTGALMYNLWDWMAPCTSSTGRVFNVRFAPAPMAFLGLSGNQYDHIHLNFTDPAITNTFASPPYACFCDPGDGYGAGDAPYSSGTTCPSERGPCNVTWYVEPRQFVTHPAGDYWLMLYMDTQNAVAPHYWGGDGDMQTFEINWMQSGSGLGDGTQMEAWFLDVYGDWYYEGPINPNTKFFAPTFNSFRYVLFRSYNGANGAVGLNYVEVVPDN
jgi:hypothetical protein